ncbi:hypothetical protein HDZ31DRAFT_74780 [Schizophyllum fasciatum]
MPVTTLLVGGLAAHFSLMIASAVMLSRADAATGSGKADHRSPRPKNRTTDNRESSRIPLINEFGAIQGYRLPKRAPPPPTTDAHCMNVIRAAVVVGGKAEVPRAGQAVTATSQPQKEIARAVGPKAKQPDSGPETARQQVASAPTLAVAIEKGSRQDAQNKEPAEEADEDNSDEEEEATGDEDETDEEDEEDEDGHAEMIVVPEDQAAAIKFAQEDEEPSFESARNVPFTKRQLRIANLRPATRLLRARYIFAHGPEFETYLEDKVRHRS